MFLLDDWTRRMCADVAASLESLELDWEKPASLSTVVICMTPRSGSTYLGSLFRDNGLGDAQEHFRVVKDQFATFVQGHNLKSYGDYLAKLVGLYATPAHFSVKADWVQFRHVYHLGAFHKYFADGKFIYLTRDNILAQAVSRFIMDETSYGDTTQKKDKDRFACLTYNRDKITAQLAHLTAIATAWETFFAIEHITPLRISYEQLKSAPEKTLKKIADYLEYDLPSKLVTETEYKKVGTSLNTELCEKYIDDLRQDQTTLVTSFHSKPMCYQ